MPVFGKPDFVFSSARVALFVDGCFWHRCPLHSTQPKSNSIFWDEKLSRNVSRDKRVNRRLRKEGWIVVRIWEHDLVKRFPVCILKIERALRKGGLRRLAS